ncbi:MAG: dienelactone hydrolase family protein [bacterium]
MLSPSAAEDAASGVRSTAALRPPRRSCPAGAGGRPDDPRTGCSRRSIHGRVAPRLPPAATSAGSTPRWTPTRLRRHELHPGHVDGCALWSAGAAPVGHLYPPHSDAPRPVVLFLHGFGGNLKGYLWALRPLTDAGWTIVAPDFGLGLWADPGGRATIDAALAFIDQSPDLDGSRIVLAGLSNGGLGVTRHAPQLGGRLRGILYYSAVVEPAAMPALAAALPGVPVFLLHGARDRRIHVATVRDAHARLRAAGAMAELTVLPEADHFLLFSHPAELAAFNGRALSVAASP